MHACLKSDTAYVGYIKVHNQMREQMKIFLSEWQEKVYYEMAIYSC